MISRSELEAYASTLSNLSEKARKDMWRYWQAIDFGDAKAARDLTIAMMYALTSDYGDAAASVAADFYERVATREFHAPTAALLADNTPYEQVNKQVRYAAGNHLFQEVQTPIDMFKYLAGCLDKDVKQPARNTILQNAKRDGLKVARVPSGISTCAYCISMAAMGFVEADTNFLPKYHPHCTCELVADVGGGVEGYNPDWYKRIYQNREVIKGDQWRGYSEIENLTRIDEYIKGGQIVLLDGAKPYLKELEVGMFLADAGHRVEFLNPTGIGKTADVFVDGVLREMKVPDGSNEGTVGAMSEHNQFKSAALPILQCERIIISSHRIAEMESVGNYLERVGSEWANWPQFSEVWHIDGGGKITELVNPLR
jgi:hypothetical protein